MPKIYSVIATDGRGAVQSVVLTTFSKKSALEVLSERRSHGSVTGVGSAGAVRGFQLLESDVRIPKEKKAEKAEKKES